MREMALAATGADSSERVFAELRFSELLTHLGLLSSLPGEHESLRARAQVRIPGNTPQRMVALAADVVVVGGLHFGKKVK